MRRRAPHTARMHGPEEVPDTDDAPSADPSLSILDLFGVVSGFTRLLWSIPIGLLLVTGTLHLTIHRLARLPTYLIAGLLFLSGLTVLRGIKPPTPRWPCLLRTAYVLVFLLFYFAPFAYWVHRFPDVDWFLINLFALIGVMIAILWSVNQLAAELATALPDPALRLESRIAGWCVLGLMALPALLLFMITAVVAVRYDWGLHGTLINFRHTPLAKPGLLLFILPIALTISMAWRCRAAALRHIEASGQVLQHQGQDRQDETDGNQQA